MKKLILLLFLVLSFSCNSDDSEEIIEECLPNIDLVGSWYWGDQVIVFTEDTFAYYSNGETYFNNPSGRIYCIQGGILYVPEFIATDFYFEIVDENSFLFGYASSPKLFVRGEDYQEWQPVCMAIDRLQNTIANPVNNENAVTYIFYDDGTLQWGLENGEQFTDEYCIYDYPGNFDLVFDYGEFSKWIRFPWSPEDGDTIVVSSVLYELKDF